MTMPFRRLLCPVVVLMLICTIGGIVPAQPKHGVILSTRCLVSPQGSDDKVIERVLYPNEPVEIDNVAVKSVKIVLDQKFSARSLAGSGGGREEDWLENFEFTIRNKSDKAITYLCISLGFPHPGSTDTSVGTFYNFTLGVDLRASGDAAKYVEPFSLQAGGSHTIRLSDKELKVIKSHLAMSKRSLADANRMVLRIPTVGYEDGLEWRQGNYLVPEKQKRSDRKVVERLGHDNEPYEVGDLSVKNTKIASRRRLVSTGFISAPRDSYEFSAESVARSGGGAEEDWLEGLQITLKNKSDKQITYIGFSIQFPETGVNGPIMIAGQFGVGIQPKVSGEQGPPLALYPAQAITFTLSAQQLKLIEDFLALRKFHLAGLNRAVINIETVILESGVMWSGGHYYKPNPDARGGYERIDQ